MSGVFDIRLLFPSIGCKDESTKMEMSSVGPVLQDKIDCQQE